MASERGSEPHLQFNQQLTWKAGRQIQNAELQRRLKALGEELQRVDQDHFNSQSLDTHAKQLASRQLLEHKDPGIRAWTAHCLVDVLKIYAPDAPYTPSELKVR